MKVIDGDSYQLGLMALVTIGMQLFFFFVAYVAQFDKVRVS